MLVREGEKEAVVREANVREMEDGETDVAKRRRQRSKRGGRKSQRRFGTPRPLGGRGGPTSRYSPTSKNRPPLTYLAESGGYRPEDEGWVGEKLEKRKLS